MKNGNKVWVELGRKSAIAVSIMSVMSLTACAGIKERMSRIGVEPPMSKIENPYQKADYQPVSLPMPPVLVANTAPNSLWQPARQTFFKDQRAHQVGDIARSADRRRGQARRPGRRRRNRGRWSGSVRRAACAR